MKKELAPKLNNNNSSILKVGNWIIDKAYGGFANFSKAEDLANTYINDPRYPNPEDKINALIKFETAKNFSTGFITGIGGFSTLPITIPASIGASWLLQARMVAAIAKIYGYNLDDERGKTTILCVIIGQDIKELLKQKGITIAKELTYVAISKLPAEALLKINQAVGFRLVAKAGEKGVISLSKIVPFIDGFIGGTIDGISCIFATKAAKKVFAPRIDEKLENAINITDISIEEMNS